MSSWASRQLSRVPLMMAFFHIVCLAKGMCTWLTACVCVQTQSHMQPSSLLCTSGLFNSAESVCCQALVREQLQPFSGAPSQPWSLPAPACICKANPNLAHDGVVKCLLMVCSKCDNFEVNPDQNAIKPLLKSHLGLQCAIGTWQHGGEVPAAFHSEVVPEGDVIHGLR